MWPGETSGPGIRDLHQDFSPHPKSRGLATLGLLTSPNVERVGNSSVESSAGIVCLLGKEGHPVYSEALVGVKGKLRFGE